MSRFQLPFERVEDENSHPLDGAKLYFFETGTNTPKDTYLDEALTTPNTNPVIADSQGQFGSIFMSGIYRVRLDSKNDVTQPDYPEDGIHSNISEGVENIADLKLLEGINNQRIYLLGYYTPGDGGSGNFYWDENSIEADNGGTIIKVTSVLVGRWLRDYTKIIDPRIFGVVGDGVTDDYDSINAALDFAESIGGAYVSLEVGVIYGIGTKLIMRSGVDFGLLTQPIAVFSETALFVQENFATIKLLAGFVGNAIEFPIDAKGPGIQGVHLDCRNQITSGSGIVIIEGFAFGGSGAISRTRPRISSCYVRAAVEHGIHVQPETGGSRIERTKCLNNDGHGIYVQGQDVKLNDNGTAYNLLCGLRIDQGDLTDSARNTGGSVRVNFSDSWGNGEHGLYMTAGNCRFTMFQADGNHLTGAFLEDHSGAKESCRGNVFVDPMFFFNGLGGDGVSPELKLTDTGMNKFSGATFGKGIKAGTVVAPGRLGWGGTPYTIPTPTFARGNASYAIEDVSSGLHEEVNVFTDSSFSKKSFQNLQIINDATRGRSILKGSLYFANDKGQDRGQPIYFEKSVENLIVNGRFRRQYENTSYGTGSSINNKIAGWLPFSHDDGVNLTQIQQTSILQEPYRNERAVKITSTAGVSVAAGEGIYQDIRGWEKLRGELITFQFKLLCDIGSDLSEISVLIGDNVSPNKVFTPAVEGIWQTHSIEYRISDLTTVSGGPDRIRATVYAKNPNSTSTTRNTVYATDISVKEAGNSGIMLDNDIDSDLGSIYANHTTSPDKWNISNHTFIDNTDTERSETIATNFLNVSYGNVYQVTADAAETIQTFSEGYDGQTITLLFKDNNVTIDFSSGGIIGNGGVDKLMPTDSIGVFTKIGFLWYASTI